MKHFVQKIKGKQTYIELVSLYYFRGWIVYVVVSLIVFVPFKTLQTIKQIVMRVAAFLFYRSRTSEIGIKSSFRDARVNEMRLTRLS